MLLLYTMLLVLYITCSEESRLELLCLEEPSVVSGVLEEDFLDLWVWYLKQDSVNNTIPSKNAE